MSASADEFLILCPIHRLSGTGCSDLFLIYTEQVKIYIIAKRLFVGHFNLHGFINLSVLNFGSLVDLYNYPVIPRIVRFICYGINNLFNIMKYFKTWE